MRRRKLKQKGFKCIGPNEERKEFNSLFMSLIEDVFTEHL